MSLRFAKREDHWKRVLSRRYSTRVERLTFSQLSCLSDGDIAFGGGINAIVGANGVGKSTIIAAVAELISKKPALLQQRNAQRLRNSRTYADTVFADVTTLVRAEEDNDGHRVTSGDFRGDCSWLDPSELASRCLNQINSDQSFTDLLESITPLSLDSDGLETVSYLVGKQYERVDIFEIDDYAGFERMPYFQVSASGADYASEGMGRGELALLLAYWTLSNLPKDSVLILEEPETHVSPRSQGCLMDVVAKFSAKNGIWVLIATHSPTIIRRIPNQQITLLLRGNGPSVTLQDPTRSEVSLLLGSGMGFGGAMLVEDAFAKSFVMAMCEEKYPEMLQRFEVLVCDSADGITAILRGFPETKPWLRLIGIYDGDQRSKIDHTKFKWPHVFLPSTLPPEREVLSQTTELKFPNRLADELGIAHERVLFAVNVASGLDHHDYIGQLASSLNMDEAIMRRAVVRLWCHTPQGEQYSSAFIGELRKLAG